MIEHFRTAIEWAALIIELIAVLVIVTGVVLVVIRRGTIRFLRHIDEAGAFESYKQQLGEPLLLGLDFLVAGDVVRTVALQPTTANVGALGLLILVRIGLSWSLVVEMTGRWPWQGASQSPQHGPATGRELACRETQQNCSGETAAAPTAASTTDRMPPSRG
jgi:uncharacterized membrane protein